MKRIFTLCLVAALTLGFVACEEPQNNDQPNTEQNGEDENNGENNGENEDVEVSPIVGTWQGVEQTDEYTKTEVYTFNADGTGSLYSEVQPTLEGVGATSVSYAIDYIYTPEEQKLVIVESIGTFSRSTTYTAILDGDSLTLSNEETPQIVYNRVKE